MRSRSSKQRKVAKKLGVHPLHLALMQLECLLLWQIQKFRDNPHNKFMRYLKPLLSEKPLEDICLLTPFAGCIALLYHHRCMYWCLVVALVVFYCFKLIYPMPTPKQIDSRIEHITRPSKCLLCTEAYSAAVVFTFLYRQISDSKWIDLGTALIYFLVIFLIGISRIISTSNFTHQIIWGWSVGITIPYLCDPLMNLVPKQYFIYKWMPLAAGSGILLVIFAVFLYSIENQDHPYMSIEKDEYKRVLKNIYVQEVTNLNRRRSRDSVYGEAGGQQKDSFVHLLETIEKRQSKYRFKAGETSVLTSGQGQYDPTGAKFA